MEMIMHAGDARQNLEKAIECAKKKDFSNADTEVKKAKEELALAHKCQTEVIQKNITENEEVSSLMFAHAQDTFMCVNTELNLSKEIIELYKTIYGEKQ